MYVYELARELGAEPRELIERAAADEMGHFSPNTKLSQEQILQLRESYVRASSQSRGSLFAGGGRPLAPPPSAMPSAPPPPAPATTDDGSYGSPLLKPIHDPNESAGAEWGGPLTFDPSGVPPSAPPPSSPAPSSPSAAQQPWDAPSWDPLPTSTSLGGPAPSQRSSVDYSGSPDKTTSRKFTEADYERQFRPDDWVAPKPETSSSTRTIAVGVVGLIVVIIATMFAGRQLGIIGPGAERNCIITQSPVADGEGVEEEVVCVDGYGKEISREIRRPDEGARYIEFGSNADDEPTRVVQMDEFCRGASAFSEFRTGFEAKLSAATSMVEVGAWYDENDGFGLAGHGRMVDSFGRAGPNRRVVELSDYLRNVRESARSGSVEQAQMLFAAAEQVYGDQILEVQNFANGNC